MTFLADIQASITDEIATELEGVRDELLRLVRDDAPRDSGELQASLEVDDWSLSGTVFRSAVFSDAPQATYTNDGTGIYGPTGSRIYPVSAPALVFYWKAAGGVVAYRSVAGQPAQNWFDDPSGAVMERRYSDALEGVMGR